MYKSNFNHSYKIEWFGLIYQVLLFDTPIDSAVVCNWIKDNYRCEVFISLILFICRLINVITSRQSMPSANTSRLLLLIK